MPAAARAHTETGAEAFAKFYIETAIRAHVTTDSSPVRELSLPGCLGCGVFIRAVGKLRVAGLHHSEGSFDLELVRLDQQFNANDYSVDVGGREHAIKIVDSAGKVVKTSQAGVATFRTRVQWTSVGWRTKDVTLL